MHECDMFTLTPVAGCVTRMQYFASNLQHIQADRFRAMKEVREYLDSMQHELTRSIYRKYINCS